MLTPRTARLWALLLVLATPCALARPGQAIDLTRADPADHTFDRWYLTTINSQPAGYFHDWMAVEQDTLRSGYEEVRHESHGGEATITRQRIEWVESTDYRPRRVTTVHQTGGQTVTKTFVFRDDHIQLTSEQNGRTVTRRLPPIEGDYLTAAQRNIAIDLHRRRGDDQFAFDTLDPLVGMTPYRSTYRRLDLPSERWELADGQRIEATPWEVTFSVLPGFSMREWADADQRMVGLRYAVNGAEQVWRLADREVAQRRFVPAELSGRSIVKPDRPIDNIRGVNKAVYELRGKAIDETRLPVVSAHQRVELIEPGRVRVTVDLEADADAVAREKGKDQPTEAHRAASIFVDHEDPAVQRLARQATDGLAGDAGPMAVAEACKRKVSAHLASVTLAIGAGTASEAARTGEGDCTESAVLLAAMLRARGIPSRCVTGLVYSAEPFAGQRDVFIYHMWTQAWIEAEDTGEDGANGESAQAGGRWVDLDAAMWRHGAGHIALGVSAMDADHQADHAALFAFMQDLQIKVIETQRTE